VDPQTNAGFSGIWGNNLFIGGKGPSSAPLYSNGNQVVLGQNGQVYVLDPYANVGAWLGTETEAPRTVSGAVNDGSGQVQLTVTAHPYRNGDWVNVVAVGGVPNATGQWVISAVAANVFSLTGSTFSGAYTSGGTVTRFFSGGAFETIAVAAGQRITNAVNNGSGLVRLTITAHGYSTGFDVTTTNVVGVTGANGTFLVTVVDPNTVDLQGSVFTGAYVSGGISINWPTAKLLAQGDGSLLIRDAEISLSGTGGSIVIDPTTPSIDITGAGGTIVISATTPSIVITGAGGTIVIDASVPDIVATDLSSNFASFGPGQVAVVSPTFGETLIGTTGFEVINKAGLGSVLVGTFGLDSSATGNGFLNVKSTLGTKTFTVNTGLSTILTVTGGDVNVASPNVYRQGGVAGLSTTLVTAKLTVGGSNGFQQFLGGILTASTPAT
jgi:hypothetical protein